MLLPFLCPLHLMNKLLHATVVAVLFHSWRYFKPEEGGVRNRERKRSRDRLYTLGCNSLDRSPVIHLWQTKHVGGEASY